MSANYCEPCGVLGMTQTAFLWCTECEEALCSDCTETHKVQKMSRNHHLIDIGKRSEEIQCSYNCLKHQHLPFDYFCVDHGVICCKECFLGNHRSCKNVTSLDNASISCKQSQLYMDFEEHLGFILEALQTVNINRNANKTRIECEEILIRNQISKTKDNVIKHFESLEQSILSQLSKMKDKYVGGINRQETYIEDLKTSVKAQKKTLEFLRDHGSEKQFFISIHLSKPLLNEIENKVKQLTESFVDTSLNFVENVMKDNLIDLGSIESNQIRCTSPFVPFNKCQITCFKHIHDIDIKGEELVGVSSITIADDNSLVFCDVSTAKVYFCIEYESYQSVMPSQYSPWDIVVIPGTSSAVMSCRYKPYIQFIDIGEHRILKTIEVKQSETGGIAATKDHIFVGTKGKIQVLDNSGNFDREICLKHEDGGIRYISVCSNGNICYSVGHAVYCITADGDPVFNYSSADFRNARNIIIDNAGNIYVMGSESQNIHQLTPTGTLVDIFLKGKLSDPLAFCFSKDCSKVYIADNDGETVSVYKTNY